MVSSCPEHGPGRPPRAWPLPLALPSVQAGRHGCSVGSSAVRWFLAGLQQPPWSVPSPQLQARWSSPSGLQLEVAGWSELHPQLGSLNHSLQHHFRPGIL